MSNINLNKQVFSKRAFEDTIDTSFTELTSSIEPPITQSVPSIEEFFQNYNALFYTIPKFGEENSHEYLVLTSQEYIGTISTEQDVIDALIAEVTELREENLTLQQELANNASSTAEEALNRLKEING